MHKLSVKIRVMDCPLPYCKGLMEPDEKNVENWKCKECNNVFFIKLVG
jgi:hypothetical protein